MNPIPVAFHIGPLQVHTYGIGLALTFWFGFVYFERRLKKNGYPTEWLVPVFLCIILAAVVGARALHVLTNLSYYTSNPGDVFAIWHGGLSSFGGLLFAVPTGIILTRRRCPELSLGRALIFRKIKERFGPNLRALICGSAPLAPETQNFFGMLGIRVLQVYGLTETTGICTMDDPDGTVDTGHVGPTIDGIEMQVGEENELIVRGPNIFPGYWNREEETAAVLRGGWFHTGDQGEKNEHGNWRIVGRVKNLLILNSGHKIPPEPIEDKLAQLLPAAQHVILVGNGRGYLCAMLTGPVEKSAVQAALDNVNRDLPHYRQIRNFTVLTETLTPDSGLLTAMGKLRRAAINERFASQIEALYASKTT